MTLQEILNSKKERLKQIKNFCPVKELHKIAQKKINDRRDFLKAIKNKNKINIIAEFKRASPSRGIILKDGNPTKISQIYEKNAACGISILTEENFFLGRAEDLIQAREATRLPVLRKDFIIDEYQIYETASLPADAILLIVRVLDDVQLRDFYQLSKECHLCPVVEVHSEDEMERAMNLHPEVIGINNRNLDSLTTDINTTRNLANRIPDNVVLVAESGISNITTINELRAIGVDAFLIGDALLNADDIGRKLRELSGRPVLRFVGKK